MNENKRKINNQQFVTLPFDKTGASEFLKKYGIAKLETIYSIDRYRLDDNRQGIILNVQEKENEVPTSIIIDAKTGQPTTEQVFDMIYGRGKQCSKRIIIFTMDKNESDFDNPTADEIAVGSLISRMNLYSLDIHLFKVSRENEILKCDIDAPDEDEKVSLSPKDLPSAIRFRFEEFWSIYYDSNSGGFYEPWNIFDCEMRQTIDWGFLISIDTNRLFAEMPIYWNDDGIKMIIKRINGDNTIMDLWTVIEEALRASFNCKIALNCTPGQDPEISIEYSKRPVNWLLKASHKAKNDFARKLFDDAFEIKFCLEEVSDNIQVVCQS